MILVDSSVWVSALRGNPPLEHELTRLLDSDQAALASPVRLELLSGSTAGGLAQLRRVLGAVPTFVPSAVAWKKVEAWVDVAARAGQRFGVMDLVIAATAVENRASVWSLDSDFERMARLRLVKLHRPPRSRRR